MLIHSPNSCNSWVCSSWSQRPATQSGPPLSAAGPSQGAHWQGAGIWSRARAGTKAVWNGKQIPKLRSGKCPLFPTQGAMLSCLQCPPVSFDPDTFSVFLFSLTLRILRPSGLVFYKDPSVCFVCFSWLDWDCEFWEESRDEECVCMLASSLSP